MIAQGDQEAFDRLRWMRPEDQQLVGKAVMAPISQQAAMEYGLAVQTDGRLAALDLQGLSPEERIAREAQLKSEYRRGPYQDKLQQLAQAFPLAAREVIPSYMAAIGEIDAKQMQMRGEISYDNSRNAESKTLIQDAAETANALFRTEAEAYANAETAIEKGEIRKRMSETEGQVNRAGAIRVQAFMESSEDPETSAKRIRIQLANIWTDKATKYRVSVQNGNPDLDIMADMEMTLAAASNIFEAYEKSKPAGAASLLDQAVGDRGGTLREYINSLREEVVTESNNAMKGQLKAMLGQNILNSMENNNDPALINTDQLKEFLREAFASGNPKRIDEAYEVLAQGDGWEARNENRLKSQQEDKFIENTARFLAKYPAPRTDDIIAAAPSIGWKSVNQLVTDARRRGDLQDKGRQILEQSVEAYKQRIINQIASTPAMQKKREDLIAGLGPKPEPDQLLKVNDFMAQELNSAWEAFKGQALNLLGERYQPDFENPNVGLESVLEPGQVNRSIEEILKQGRIPLLPPSTNTPGGTTESTVGKAKAEMADVIRSASDPAQGGRTVRGYIKALGRRGPSLMTRLRVQYPNWESLSSERRVILIEKELTNEFELYRDVPGGEDIPNLWQEGLKRIREESKEETKINRPAPIRRYNRPDPIQRFSPPGQQLRDQSKWGGLMGDYDQNAVAGLNLVGVGPDVLMSAAPTQVVEESVTVPPEKAPTAEPVEGGAEPVQLQVQPYQEAQPAESESTTAEAPPEVSTAIAITAGAQTGIEPVTVYNTSQTNIQALARLARGETRMTAQTPALPQVASDAPAQYLPLDVRSPEHPWSMTATAIRAHKLRNYEGPIWKPGRNSAYVPIVQPGENTAVLPEQEAALIGDMKNLEPRARTIAIGQMAVEKGWSIWQHPNFHQDRGFVPEGGQRVWQRPYASAHNEDRALDFPLSHNSEQRLDELYAWLDANRAAFGIGLLLWRSSGHYDHLHVEFN